MLFKNLKFYIPEYFKRFFIFLPKVFALFDDFNNSDTNNIIYVEATKGP